MNYICFWDFLKTNLLWFARHFGKKQIIVHLATFHKVYDTSSYSNLRSLKKPQAIYHKVASDRFYLLFNFFFKSKMYILRRWWRLNSTSNQAFPFAYRACTSISYHILFISWFFFCPLDTYYIIHIDKKFHISRIISKKYSLHASYTLNIYLFMQCVYVELYYV